MLSAVIYVAITVAAITLVMTTLNPIVEKTTQSITIDKAKDIFATLDMVILEVASEGKGSVRRVNIETREGQIKIENYSSSVFNNGRIFYELKESKTEIISPRTKRKIGNLILRSNANVTVTEYTNNFTMENKHLIVVINKTGNSSSYDVVNVSKSVERITLKDTDNTDNFNVTIKINGDFDNGSGYVDAKDTGVELGKGEIIAHINSSKNFYEVHFILETDADFLTIELTNNTYFTPSSVSVSVISSTFTNFNRGGTTQKYLLGTSSTEVGGLIFAGKTLINAQTGATANMTQNYDENKFYLVFTEGDETTITNRMDLVKADKFESKVNPSFAYRIDDKQLIRIGLEYNNLEIHGDDVIEPGLYTLSIFNKGVNSASGKTMIGITKV